MIGGIREPSPRGPESCFNRFDQPEGAERRIVAVRRIDTIAIFCMGDLWGSLPEGPVVGSRGGLLRAAGRRRG